MKNESRSHCRSPRQVCAEGDNDSLDTVRRIENAFFDLSRPNTAPRRMLVEKLAELARSGEAFSTDDLWQDLRAANGRIGRATVYRSIEQLVESKVLDRVELSDGSHKYRVCGGSHHHHLVCTLCNCVVDFRECLSAQKFEEIGRQHGFTVNDHKLTVYGTCSRCLKSGGK
ncbi:MAG: transcriptional repressor [Syntrophobacteraceae bacterium]|nr:transcriptional repressor [Syntrophobacteraceae bacterium]